MKTVLGVLMCLAGVALGLYVGIWLCLVGGFVSIIDGARAAGQADAGMIAWGIIRVLFASALGTISAYVLIIPGYVLINSD